MQCITVDQSYTKLNNTSTAEIPGCEVVAWCVVDGWLVVWCVVESVLEGSNLQVN